MRGAATRFLLKPFDQIIKEIGQRVSLGRTTEKEINLKKVKLHHHRVVRREKLRKAPSSTEEFYANSHHECICVYGSKLEMK
ncbi:unnamed protein product [Lupinus luteus]|uniref:Uncharacterized protein n=1 Tax=Lupinus luteus TaxID=3873 RepID=A0AAV1W886_LUPLU